MSFLIIAIPSMIVVLLMKFMYNKDISTKEFVLHIGVVLAGVLVCMGLSYSSAYFTMGDSEILNGRVQSTGIHKEYCGSGSSCTEYHWREKCHYSTDSNGKRTKHCTSYKVYHYPYEFFYNVRTTVGTYTIDRIDEQGVGTPPRFSLIQPGDIASTTHWYKNYLLANKNSVFYKFSEDKVLNNDQEMKKIPDYPDIEDYYNVKRIINASGIAVQEQEVQTLLDKELSILGEQKQVNILVILYEYKDRNFVKRTLMKWRGGKKNDVLLFFGIDNERKIQYFSSTSYAEGMNNTELHSTLRIDNNGKTFSPELIKYDIDLVRTKFSRIPAKEFEYLALNISPSMGAIVFSSLMCLILSAIFGFYLKNEEVV